MHETPPTQSRDIWSKFKIASSVVTPLVVAYFGFVISTTVKDSEVKAKEFEVAANILKDPSAGGNQALRDWAIETFTFYSGRKLSEKEKLALQAWRVGNLPVAATPPSLDGIDPRDLERKHSLLYITSNPTNADIAIDGARVPVKTNAFVWAPCNHPMKVRISLNNKGRDLMAMLKCGEFAWMNVDFILNATNWGP
jgi:hypothetical protein